MEQVGVVAEVWRYPVKSFQGERVDSLDVAPGGATGDRTLAVVDPAARKVLSAKRYADLFMASARLDGERVVLTLPDGSEHAADDPGVHAALSDWLGLAVRLEPPPEAGVFPMEMYSGMYDEDTPLFDWPGPAGTWLDLADAHWLTTSSLAALASEHPDAEWDVRRFRPTALFETPAGGFAEEAWTTIEAGTVGSEVFMATPRCSMPSRAQPGLTRDKSIATTIRDANSDNVGVYARITQSGTVRVGDSVHAS
jgi:uncharacterized protein YcbX